MKTLNIILGILFIAFAGLQWNDPADDRLFWILMYVSVAAVCLYAAVGRYNAWTISLGILVAIFMLFRLFPAFIVWLKDGAPSIVGSMKASSPHVELIREFLGLILCISVLIFQLIKYIRWQKTQKKFEEL